ncbi:MAG: 16S rRNA (adenine(1518)-N(6)/adenine(1519)-N(6))-dimethyltransferase RsmA [Patescibacteria group bacterium]
MEAKKSFGQHFLKDASIVRKIIDAADFSLFDSVVEIGPGQGALTDHLVGLPPFMGGREGGFRLVLIEADRDLIQDLEKNYQAEVIQADAAKVDFDSLKLGNWLLIGNLPYNAANAIIMNALTAFNPPQKSIVMIQKEVADRMLAQPGQMSLLSVAVQLYADPKRLFNVKPGSFLPPPKVTSSVIELTIAKKTTDPERIISLAKAGFQNRRKQLHRNLTDTNIMDSADVKKTLQAIKKKTTVRAQELSVADWIDLASKISKK